MWLPLCILGHFQILETVRELCNCQNKFTERKSIFVSLAHIFWITKMMHRGAILSGSHGSLPMPCESRFVVRAHWRRCNAKCCENCGTRVSQILFTLLTLLLYTITEEGAMDIPGSRLSRMLVLRMFAVSITQFLVFSMLSDTQSQPSSPLENMQILHGFHIVFLQKIVLSSDTCFHWLFPPFFYAPWLTLWPLESIWFTIPEKVTVFQPSL